MTAKIAVDVDALTAMARLSIKISTTAYTQKILHECHTFTDSPEYSFDLVRCTNQIDQLSRQICVIVGKFIGKEELKKCFDMEREILKKDLGIGEDDDE